MKGEHEPGFLHSLLTFGGVVVTVIVGLLWFGISLHSLLLVALIWVAGNAAALGLRYKSIKTAMTAGIEKGLGAIYIFILIGVLVAALIEGGTIGSLIYYGVDLLHPAIFLPTGLLLCTLMSLATGTDRYHRCRAGGSRRSPGYSICRADALRRGINRTPGRHLTRIRYQPAGPATASTIPVFEMPANNINKLVTHAGRRNSGRGPFTPGVGDDSLD